MTFSISVSISVSARIVLPIGRNNWLNFSGESDETRFLAAESTEGCIPKETLLSPTIKAPLQNNCHEPVFRIDTECCRQYTLIFPGMVFPRERNNRNNFVGLVNQKLKV